MSLNATVQKLRNQDRDRQALAVDRSAFVLAWQNDVMAVFQTFEKALEPFVVDGSAKIYPTNTTIEEDLLGEYDIAALVIEVVGRRIYLMPKARILPGATGRMDLYREDRPSEANRIILLRGASAVDHHPDVWLIQDRREEANSFERALAGTSMTFHNILRKPSYRMLDGPAIQDSIDYVLNV